MKKFKFKIQGNEYQVQIKEFENNIAEIDVNGSTYHVELEHYKTKSVTKTPKLVRARVVSEASEKVISKSDGYTVHSPLPGTITKILVNEGDTVKSGDVLLMMEAMKMENNVLAEKEGVIMKVSVKVGQTVLQNDSLVTIS